MAPTSNGTPSDVSVRTTDPSTDPTPIVDTASASASVADVSAPAVADTAPTADTAKKLVSPTVSEAPAASEEPADKSAESTQDTESAPKARTFTPRAREPISRPSVARRSDGASSSRSQGSGSNQVSSQGAGRSMSGRSSQMGRSGMQSGRMSSGRSQNNRMNNSNSMNPSQSGADRYNDEYTNAERTAERGNDSALKEITGFIDLTVEGHAVVRQGFSQSRNDAYLSIAMVRKLGIRAGDQVTGTAREPRENDRYWGLKDITSINGKPISEARNRRRFEDLVPVYPKQKFVLETGKEPVSTRLIDLVAPIGKGQRGLIVSPPKAGKTTIMKEISTGIAANFKDVHLMAVLIGERPEEVTDIARHISAITEGKGETAASNFDEPATEQTRVAEVALERAKRLVENGQDVVILLDSITRLARAYNLAIPTSGRTLSGGFDPAALYPPKRFFGAARNFEEGGSLTIIGTALVDTGSRMDDLVYEEFKGTGNMELHLDRRIAERRIYPAINLQRSGTRRDDLLFSADEYQSVVMMHRMIDMLGEDERTAMVVRRLKETNTNQQFLASLKEG